MLSVAERAGNFKEVVTGFDEDSVYLESQRCMTCGSRAIIEVVEECRLCQACERNCPQKAISIKPFKTAEPYVKIAIHWKRLPPWIGTDGSALGGALTSTTMRAIKVMIQSLLRTEDLMPLSYASVTMPSNVALTIWIHRWYQDKRTDGSP
jgi:ferredoxin